MVTTFYPPYNFGGDGIFVRSLARALVGRGHEVEVVFCEDAFRLCKGSTPILPTEDDGIRSHRLRSPWGLASPLITQQTGRAGLKKHKIVSILQHGFDVVNFHNVSLVGGPAVLGLSKAPVNLYTLHEHWLLCPTHIFWKNRKQACDRRQCVRCCIRSGIPPQLWRFTEMIQRSLKHVDALLSPSEYTARRHREAGITTPIRVLPTFSSLAANALSDFHPSGRPKFLFVGRVTASKGIHTLLKDFVVLDNYELYVVGDGDLRESLQRRYLEHKNIYFKGMLSQSELVALYTQATAVILPSLAPEVFPLSILEALACGTPAIVRDSGGSRESIDRTGGGLVYESSEQFYKAVHALANDTKLRDTLAQYARAGYERYYSEQRYLDFYLGIIDTIRKEKRRGLN